MKIEGKLYSKAETKQVSASFKKREFVIEYAENPIYPEFIKLEVSQDKCALIDPLQVGDWLQVEFNLRGRKWTNPEGEEVIFNQLNAWRINKGVQPVVPEIPVTENAPNNQMQNIVDPGDDLPF